MILVKTLHMSRDNNKAWGSNQTKCKYVFKKSQIPTDAEAEAALPRDNVGKVQSWITAAEEEIRTRYALLSLTELQILHHGHYRRQYLAL